MCVCVCGCAHACQGKLFHERREAKVPRLGVSSKASRVVRYCDKLVEEHCTRWPSSFKAAAWSSANFWILGTEF